MKDKIENVLTTYYPYLSVEDIFILYDPNTIAPIVNLKIKNLDRIFKLHFIHLLNDEELKCSMGEQLIPYVNVYLRKEKIMKIYDNIRKV